MPCKHSDFEVQQTATYFGITWCVYCLWEVTDEVQNREISIEALPPIETIGWDDETAEEALKNTNSEHYARIYNADINFAIIVHQEDDKYIILDGCHRYVKIVKLLGQKTVKCKVIAPG